MFADSLPVTLRLTIVKGGRAGVRCPRGLSGENQKVLKYLRTFLAMNRIVFVRPRRGSSRSTLLGNPQAPLGDIMGVAKGRYPYVMDNCCSARSTLVIWLYYLPRHQLADSPSAGGGIDRHLD